jgi:hypothetical protein
VAVESQHMKKATMTRQLEKVLLRMLSLLSCIPFVAELSLDAMSAMISGESDFAKSEYRPPRISSIRLFAMMDRIRASIAEELRLQRKLCCHCAEDSYAAAITRR